MFLCTIGPQVVCKCGALFAALTQSVKWFFWEHLVSDRKRRRIMDFGEKAASALHKIVDERNELEHKRQAAQQLLQKQQQQLQQQQQQQQPSQPQQQQHANRRPRAAPQSSGQTSTDQPPAHLHTQQQQQQRFQQMQQLQVQQQLQQQSAQSQPAAAAPVDAQEAKRRLALGVMWTTLKAAVPAIPDAEISERLKLEYARLVSVGQ